MVVFCIYSYDQLNRIKTAVSSQNTYQTAYSYDDNGNILSLLRNDHNNATIDNLTYTYNTLENNRLNKIRDTSGDNTGLTSSPTPFSYQYDNIGNLIEDEEGEISQINWTVYGKVASVTKQDNTEISYKYDATGNRIYKKVVSSSVSKETHYVRDGSGNVLAIYENKEINELVIYGSSRLGSYNAKTETGKRTIGNKKYELSNHLGNVLSVIFDNKIGIDNLGNDLIADYYEPLVISESDYYPFGMAMKERSFSNEEYRFGFNTQEKTPEIGEDTYTAEFWQYDSKIARRWNVDPVVKPYESSYAAFAGNPIYLIDINGDNASTHTDKDGNVIAVYDDGDKGIYVHEKLPNDYAKNDKEIDEGKKALDRNINEKIGESLQTFSFVEGGASFTLETEKNGNWKPKGFIEKGNYWAKFKVQLVLDKSFTIVGYALGARTNQKYDIKASVEEDGKKGGVYYGSILYNTGNLLNPNGIDIYASARDAGNFAAGAKAARSIMPNSVAMYGFGAYNKSGKFWYIPFTILADIGGRFAKNIGCEKCNDSVLSGTYNGEDLLTGRAIELGMKKHSQFKYNLLAW